MLDCWIPPASNHATAPIMLLRSSPHRSGADTSRANSLPAYARASPGLFLGLLVEQEASPTNVPSFR